MFSYSNKLRSKEKTTHSYIAWTIMRLARILEWYDNWLAYIHTFYTCNNLTLFLVRKGNKLIKCIQPTHTSFAAKEYFTRPSSSSIT